MRTQHELRALVLKPKPKPARAMARAHRSTWLSKTTAALPAPAALFFWHSPSNFFSHGRRPAIPTRALDDVEQLGVGGVCNKKCKHTNKKPKRLKCAEILRQSCLSSQTLAARQTQAGVRQLTDAPRVVSLVVIVYWTADLKAQSCVVQGGGG